MNGVTLTFMGVRLVALGSGALWWPDRGVLCVSDLHLGKSQRLARRVGGAGLPPYETQDTLLRLEHDLRGTAASTVICLGDSFDDLDAAQELPEEESSWIHRLQAGRRWIWIEGNHDPGPIDLPGSHLASHQSDPLCFRHIALRGARGEVSGHYHPKVRVKTRLRRVSRPAFLIDRDKVILPAYGTYTGGLQGSDEVLQRLMLPDAQAVLTGPTPRLVPMPRLVMR